MAGSSLPQLSAISVSPWRWGRSRPHSWTHVGRLRGACIDSADGNTQAAHVSFSSPEPPPHIPMCTHAQPCGTGFLLTLAHPQLTYASLNSIRGGCAASLRTHADTGPHVSGCTWGLLVVSGCTEAACGFGVHMRSQGAFTCTHTHTGKPHVVSGHTQRPHVLLGATLRPYKAGGMAF